jgi:hypothetical protein
MCLSCVTHVFKLKENTSITFFKYGKQKPDNNLNMLNYNTRTSTLDKSKQKLLLWRLPSSILFKCKIMCHKTKKAPVEQIWKNLIFAFMKLHNIPSKSDDTYHNKLTQLKNLWELWTHGVLQMFCFCLRHLTTWEIKHLLTKKFENSHIVLTKAFIRLAGSNNVRNKRLPVLGPFTF